MPGDSQQLLRSLGFSERVSDGLRCNHDLTGFKRKRLARRAPVKRNAADGAKPHRGAGEVTGLHFRADIDHHGVPDRGLGPGADTLEAVAPDKGEEFTRGFRRADLCTLEIRDIDEVHRGAGDERIHLVRRRS